MQAGGDAVAEERHEGGIVGDDDGVVGPDLHGGGARRIAATRDKRGDKEPGGEVA
jgi:hypothetical protein